MHITYVVPAGPGIDASRIMLTSAAHSLRCFGHADFDASKIGKNRSSVLRSRQRRRRAAHAGYVSPRQKRPLRSRIPTRSRERHRKTHVIEKLR
jgi:hypothetical protein